MGKGRHKEKRAAPRFPVTAEIGIKNPDYEEYREVHSFEGVNVSKSGLYVSGSLPGCEVGASIRLTVLPEALGEDGTMALRGKVVRVEGGGFALEFGRVSKKDKKRLGLLIAACESPSFRGNAKTNVLHAAGCRYFEGKQMTQCFVSAAVAVEAGYRPHKGCVPEA